MPPDKRWSYEVDVGTISGEVTAPDDDAALSAATDDALGQHFNAILGGTWGLRQLDESERDETIAAPLEDDVQEVEGEE